MRTRDQHTGLRDRIPRLEAACAEMQATVRHPPASPPIMCDGPVRMQPTFVMPS